MSETTAEIARRRIAKAQQEAAKIYALRCGFSGISHMATEAVEHLILAEHEHLVEARAWRLLLEREEAGG